MITHHTAEVDGLSVFYREAGDPANPKLLLLGGFPASSHQFRNLIPALAERFHVLSPDYPGFGNTDMPDPATWDYTFDHLAEIVEACWSRSASPARWASTCRTTAGRSATGSSPATPTGWSGRSSRTPTATRKGSPPRGTASGTRCGWTAAQRPKHRWRRSWSPTRSRRSTPPATATRRKISPDNWNMDLFFLARPERAPGTARPVLRLPHQRRALPDVAGVAARAPAPHADPLGPGRHLLHPRGWRGLPARPARRRAASGSTPGTSRSRTASTRSPTRSSRFY